MISDFKSPRCDLPKTENHPPKTVGLATSHHPHSAPGHHCGFGMCLNFGFICPKNQHYLLNLFRQEHRLSDQVLHDLIGVTPFLIGRISTNPFVDSEVRGIEKSRTFSIRWRPLLPTGGCE